MALTRRELDRQMDQQAPDLGGTELFRRSAEVAGEAEDMLDIGGLGQRARLRMRISSIMR